MAVGVRGPRGWFTGPKERKDPTSGEHQKNSSVKPRGYGRPKVSHMEDKCRVCDRKKQHREQQDELQMVQIGGGQHTASH